MTNLEDKEKLHDCHEKTAEDIMERLMKPQIKGADSENDDDLVYQLPPPASTSECLKCIELIQNAARILNQILY